MGRLEAVESMCPLSNPSMATHWLCDLGKLLNLPELLLPISKLRTKTYMVRMKQNLALHTTAH